MISLVEVLAFILRTREQNLLDVLEDRENYRLVRIPKEVGFRKTYSPIKSLGNVQKLIKKFLQGLPVENAGAIHMKGVCGRTSHFDHTQAIAGGRYIFGVDLKDAFPSVRVERLRPILTRKILEGILRFEFELLECQRFSGLVDAGNWAYARAFRVKRERLLESVFYPILRCVPLPFGKREHPLYISPHVKELAEGLADLILELTTFRGVLPQGTCTAPFLFFLALTEGGLLEDIKDALPPDYKVSVYVDNIDISHDAQIPKFVRNRVLGAIKKNGFRVNMGKVRYRRLCGGGAIVTGLRILEDGRVVIPKKTRKKWRGIAHRALLSGDPKLRNQINGFVASIVPLYTEISKDGKKKFIIPSQLKAPLAKLDEGWTSC